MASAHTRTVSLYLGMFLSVLFLGCAGLAQNPIYTVSVEVDLTRPSSSQAKEDAFIVGREKAFAKLLKRLSLSKEYEEQPLLSSEQIPEYIKSFSVEKEQHSSVRYMATMVFEFDIEKVQKLLEENQIDFSEREMIKLILLPIFIKDGRLILWEEEENIWRKAWLSTEETSEDIQVTCPLSDLEDQILAPIKNLSDLKRTMLLHLKERYKAQDVLVAIFSLDTHECGEDASMGGRGYVRYLPFALRDLKSVYGVGPFSVPKEPEEFLGNLRKRLMEEVSDSWRSLNKEVQQSHTVRVSVRFETMEEWQRALEKLKSLSVIKDVHIHSLSKRENVLWVSFRGTLDQFRERLALEGFTVNVENDIVILT